MRTVTATLQAFRAKAFRAAPAPGRLLTVPSRHAPRARGRWARLDDFCRRAARLPRFAGAAAAIGFLLVALVYGAVLAGHGRALAEALTGAVGLEVETIRLTGLMEMNEFAVLEALELKDGASLAVYDVAAARARVEALPWIASASVSKFYPGTLAVEITESEPLAIWQRGGVVSLIDRDGAPIADTVGGRFAHLPLVIGNGANRAAGELIETLRRVPALAPRVRGAARVADRRWDLYLDNGVVVRLPETGMDAALASLHAMDVESGLLARDIAAVDLRLADRVLVRLSPRAAADEKRRRMREPGANT